MHIAFLIQAVVALLSVRPVLADLSFCSIVIFFCLCVCNVVLFMPLLLLYTVVYPFLENTWRVLHSAVPAQWGVLCENFLYPDIRRILRFALLTGVLSTFFLF